MAALCHVKTELETGGCVRLGRFNCWDFYEDFFSLKCVKSSLISWWSLQSLGPPLLSVVTNISLHVRFTRNLEIILPQSYALNVLVYDLKPVNLLSCKHVYQVFFRNPTLILFCHLLSALEHEHAKTTKPFNLSISVFILTSIIIWNSHTRLYDFDMKCDVCNKMIIAVCDFSAVKGFQAEIWNSVTKRSVSTVFVCACLYPYCLFAYSRQFTHHCNFTST